MATVTLQESAHVYGVRAFVLLTSVPFNYKLIEWLCELVTTFFLFVLFWNANTISLMRYWSTNGVSIGRSSGFETEIDTRQIPRKHTSKLAVVHWRKRKEKRVIETACSLPVFRVTTCIRPCKSSSPAPEKASWLRPFRYYHLTSKEKVRKFVWIPVLVARLSYVSLVLSIHIT